MDVIEAGFPIASPDDFEAVKQIAEVVGNDVWEVSFILFLKERERVTGKN